MMRDDTSPSRRDMHTCTAAPSRHMPARELLCACTHRVPLDTKLSTKALKPRNSPHTCMYVAAHSILSCSSDQAACHCTAHHQAL